MVVCGAEKTSDLVGQAVVKHNPPLAVGAGAGCCCCGLCSRRRRTRVAAGLDRLQRVNSGDDDHPQTVSLLRLRLEQLQLLSVLCPAPPVLVPAVLPMPDREGVIRLGGAPHWDQAAGGGVAVAIASVVVMPVLAAALDGGAVRLCYQARHLFPAEGEGPPLLLTQPESAGGGAGLHLYREGAVRRMLLGRRMRRHLHVFCTALSLVPTATLCLRCPVWFRTLRPVSPLLFPPFFPACVRACVGACVRACSLSFTAADRIFGILCYRIEGGGVCGCGCGCGCVEGPSRYQEQEPVGPKGRYPRQLVMPPGKDSKR